MRVTSSGVRRIACTPTKFREWSADAEMLHVRCKISLKIAICVYSASYVGAIINFKDFSSGNRACL